MGARLVNVSLGFWLYLSAFLWPHTHFERSNAWVCGIVAVTSALLGLRAVRVGRYVNALVGAWLIVSALFMRRSMGATFWNHLLVGFALALFAMLPSLSSFRTRRADV
jgi:hypothetical protein